MQHRSGTPPLQHGADTLMHFRRLVFSALAVQFAAATAALAQSPQLNTILGQLDTASAKFKSLQANVHYDNYTRAVKDHDLHNGILFVERVGGTNHMGAVDFGPSDTTPVMIRNYDGSVLHNYTVGNNQDDIFKAGDKKATYEIFLTLGFGGSGKALSQGWNITDGGSETLSDGSSQVKTEKLDLVPKDPAVANIFTHVTVWMDPVRGVSLKQIFYAPNGDTRTAEYT